MEKRAEEGWITVTELADTLVRDHGLPFGATVWLNSYIVLPLAKLYEPIWKYDPRTLAKDLGDHLVYGIATAGANRALAATG